MAASGTVGILRALLTADASAYAATMKKSADSTKAFGSSVAAAGSTAARVSPQLTRLEKSFQGDKLLYSANNLVKAITNIGGATKLTAAEQARANRTLTEAIDKYRVLGQQAPKAMLDLERATRRTEQAAGGLSGKMVALGTAVGSFIGNFASNLLQNAISSLIGFGKAALDSADNIQDLSEKLGISVEAVQLFEVAAKHGGTSIEVFDAAMSKLNLNLGQGAKATKDALSALGLEFGKLREMSREEQFLAVADALQQIRDPAEQARLGVQLFGKAFTALKPAIDAGLRAAGEGLDFWNAHEVEVLARSKQEWQDWTNWVINKSGQGLVKLREIAEEGFRAITMWFPQVPPIFGPTLVPGKPIGTPIPTKTPPPFDPDAEANAKKAVAALAELRKGLEALGIVTKQQVNEELNRFTKLLALAQKEGIDYSVALAAMLPELQALATGAKKSGVEVMGLTNALDAAHDAWMRLTAKPFDIAPGFDASKLSEGLKLTADEMARMSALPSPAMWEDAHGLAAIFRDQARGTREAQRHHVAGAMERGHGRSGHEAVRAHVAHGAATPRGASGD